MLTLPEETLLLSINNDSGKLSDNFSVRYTIIGSILKELEFRKKIKIVRNTKKEPIIEIVDNSKEDEIIFDKTISFLEDLSEPREILKSLYFLDDKYSFFKEELLSYLIKKGIIEKLVEKKFKIINIVRYPIIKPKYKEDLFIEINNQIYDNWTFSDHIRDLLSIYGAKGLTLSIDKEYRKKTNKKVREIVKSDIIGNSIRVLIKIENLSRLINSIKKKNKEIY